MSAPGKRTILAICAGGLLVAAAVAAFLFATGKLSTGSLRRAAAPDDRRWQAVAPGRVEAWSGEIKLTAQGIGPIGEVLVKANERVLAGEPLVRLQDDELLARLAVAETQVALRQRARNDQSASGRAAERRRTEDGVADAEKAVIDARNTLDRGAVEKRSGVKPEPDISALRSAWLQAQERLRQRRTELRKLEADKDIPLPTAIEGQLTIARNEKSGIDAAIEKLTIRAPINGSVLQVNAKAGELASPSAAQPLVVMGDVSALRVRAEVDERDLGDVKVGQAVTVRALAFAGREFAGKVSSVAPVVEPGRAGARGARNLTDVDVADVVIDLAETGSLAVGMKVDVYFYGPVGK